MIDVTVKITAKFTTKNNKKIPIFIHSHKDKNTLKFVVIDEIFELNIQDLSTAMSNAINTGI